MTRRYEHDCNRCAFLGQHRQYDVYVCRQGGWPTVVLRHGDDGPDYHSGAHLVDDLPGPMAQAAAELMREMRDDATA